jgi:hypothetical protein
VVIGYLIPHLVLDVGGGRREHAGRDGDGGNGQVDGDGDGEAKRGRSDRVAGLPFMAVAGWRRVGDEARQADVGEGKTATDKWVPAKSIPKQK